MTVIYRESDAILQGEDLGTELSIEQAGRAGRREDEARWHYSREDVQKPTLNCREKERCNYREVHMLNYREKEKAPGTPQQVRRAAVERVVDKNGTWNGL